MRKRRFVIDLWATLGMCGTLVSAVAAQPPIPPGPDPCTTKTITCPPPMSTNYFVQINLEPDASSVCRFNPRIIDDLKINVGDGVWWSFCNACSTDMEVEFSGTTGPFDDFLIFLPPPASSNLVSVPIGCKDDAWARGIQAQNEGDHKYTLSARKLGAPSFPDIIDPKLEIDDRTFRLWLHRLALLLGGAGLGFVGARLFSRNRADGN